MYDGISALISLKTVAQMLIFDSFSHLSGFHCFVMQNRSKSGKSSGVDNSGVDELGDEDDDDDDIVMGVLRHTGR